MISKISFSMHFENAFTKSNSLISNYTAAMILSSFSIFFN